MNSSHATGSDIGCLQNDAIPASFAKFPSLVNEYQSLFNEYFKYIAIVVKWKTEENITGSEGRFDQSK